MRLLEACRSGIQVENERKKAWRLVYCFSVELGLDAAFVCAPAGGRNASSPRQLAYLRHAIQVDIQLCHYSASNFNTAHASPSRRIFLLYRSKTSPVIIVQIVGPR